MNKSNSFTLAIIIPAYNEENHIRECLESIAAQVIMPDEVIVVDNNCTDNTIEIAKQYKFVKIVKENKQGILYARNKGFNMAKSDILGRIDADTNLPKDWVQKVKKYYSSPKNRNSAITGSGYFRNLMFPPRGFNRLVLILFAFTFNRFNLGHYILWGANMAFLRKDWQNVQTQTCDYQDIHEDLDLSIHLHRQGVKIVYLPSLNVTVIMKRILNDWPSLYANMMWWPNTLRRHNNWRWIFGLLGAYFLLIFSVPLVLLNKPIILTKNMIGHLRRLKLRFMNS